MLTLVATDQFSSEYLGYVVSAVGDAGVVAGVDDRGVFLFYILVSSINIISLPTIFVAGSVDQGLALYVYGFSSYRN